MIASIFAVIPIVGADSDITSTTPPEGYEPETVEPFIGGTKVLLIKDVNPWGYPSNEKALQELGKTYNVINSGMLATTDLSEYEIVIIASDQYTRTYNNLISNKDKIADYVYNGGVLVAHACDRGWHSGYWSGSFLPMGVTHVNLYYNYLDIVDSTSPIVSGITGADLDEWQYSTHGYFTNLPADADIIIGTTRNPTGDPTYIEYSYGDGTVLATMQTIEWPWGHRIVEVRKNLLRNEIGYAQELVTPPVPVEKLIDDYFPYYYFSSGEQYYPCSFYFDNDSFVDNNQENYDARKGMWNKSYVYVHTVEDDTYFTIQYWLYSAFNYHPVWRDHDHDWDAIVFVVFDKGDLSQPIEVRMAYHYYVGIYSWEDVEKIDDSNVVAYVAEGSHGAYNSSTKMYGWPLLDSWTLGGLQYTPDDFNGYRVWDCTGEVWRGPFLGILVFRRFCDVTNQLTRGDAQYEPVEGYWPRGYHGKGPDGKAPWHDKRWFTTKPKGPWGVTEFGVDCPVDLHIYDPLSRHVGINYETGEPEIENPNATCSIEPEGQYITIFDPIEGDYRVEIVGLENGTYNFSMVCSDYMKFIDWVERKDVPITKDEKQTFTLNPGMPYGIWANSTESKPKKAIQWSGSKTVVNGKVHSNDGIKVSGSDNLINGTTSYVSTFKDSDSKNVYVYPPIQFLAKPMPVYYGIEDYKPGGQKQN
jgi:hypothetical protein